VMNRDAERRALQDLGAVNVKDAEELETDLEENGKASRRPDLVPLPGAGLAGTAEPRLGPRPLAAPQEAGRLRGPVPIDATGLPGVAEPLGEPKRP